MDFGTLPEATAGIATRKAKWDRKYQKKHGITSHKAEGLSDAALDRLSKLSKRIYHALYMSGYARMDFRMRPDGSVYVLEANCNPDLSHGEDFADAAAAAGVSYEALLHRIIRLGLSYEAEWRLYDCQKGGFGTGSGSYVLEKGTSPLFSQKISPSHFPLGFSGRI